MVDIVAELSTDSTLIRLLAGSTTAEGFSIARAEVVTVSIRTTAFALSFSIAWKSQDRSN